MTCSVCGAKTPPLLPCGIAPRYYVNDFGFIVGIIDGCPFEPDKLPDYVPEDILPRMDRDKRDAIELRAEELVNAESYEDLWTARNRENYHLNFDAQNRLGIWYAANSGSLHYPHKGRVRRSKAKGS
jgi:hypothetical protein